MDGYKCGAAVTDAAIKCRDNAKTCAAANECATAMDGYRCGAAVGDAAVKCGDNAKTCSATEACLIALDGFACDHATPASTTKGIACTVANCKTCTVATGAGCTACKAGFYLNGAVCYTCDPNCKTADANGCGADEANGAITANNACKKSTTTSGCKDGWGISGTTASTTGTCVKCPTNCKRCDTTANKCDECIAAIVTNGVTGATFYLK